MKERTIHQKQKEIIDEFEDIKKDYNKTKVIEFLNKYHIYTRNLYNHKEKYVNATVFLNMIKSNENELTEDEKKYINGIYESFEMDLESYNRHKDTSYDDDYIPYFFPSLNNSTRFSPINDINEEWIVDNKKFFKKPVWFIYHEDLNIGHLRNFIISIPGAAPLF